jgi:hypothetical protein
MRRKPPLPISKALVICRQIFQDQHTNEYLLLGPTHEVAVPHFPAAIDVSVFARWTAVNGAYRLEIQVQDLADGSLVCRQVLADPLEDHDPLRVVLLTLHHIRLEFPRPGKYDVIILANDEEVVRDVFYAHQAARKDPS